MFQIPFGEIESVRDWLGICGTVGKPPVEIKSREVLGFDCKRSEVSRTNIDKTLIGIIVWISTHSMNQYRFT